MSRKINRRTRIGLWVLFIAIAVPAQAEELVFSAPPRETGENESEVYQPIADYLSQVTGKKFVYRHSNNWLSYQDEMRKGTYDLVFDGPHFVSWRMAHLKHVPIAKLPGKLAFVAIARKDNNLVNEVKDLAGRPVCGLAPPNLATLTLYNQFNNPARQPLIIEVKSFALSYKGVLERKCAGGVMRDAFFDKTTEGKENLKVVFRSDGVPNQAFSAGPKITPEMRAKITEALLSPDARKHMPEFFNRYNKDKDLVAAPESEFRDLLVLLKDTWGF